MTNIKYSHSSFMNSQSREYQKGMDHCTVDLLLDLFGLPCFANKNKKCQLSYSLFQTSQTGGQRYSDTSPFSIPWSVIEQDFLKQSCPINLSFCPILSCPVPFICSAMFSHSYLVSSKKLTTQKLWGPIHKT
jgi:hypothetical protein